MPYVPDNLDDLTPELREPAARYRNLRTQEHEAARHVTAAQEAVTAGRAADLAAQVDAARNGKPSPEVHAERDAQTLLEAAQRRLLVARTATEEEGRELAQLLRAQRPQLRDTYAERIAATEAELTDLGHELRTALDNAKHYGNLWLWSETAGSDRGNAGLLVRHQAVRAAAEQLLRALHEMSEAPALRPEVPA